MEKGMCGSFNYMQSKFNIETPLHEFVEEKGRRSAGGFMHMYLGDNLAGDG